MPAPASVPTPRFSLRWKITLPFILLALLLSVGMGYLLRRFTPGVDVVATVDAQGTSLLSVRRALGGSPGEYSTQRGEAFFSSWPFVQRLLAGAADSAIGDKQTGVHAVRQGNQDLPRFFVGGPVGGAPG